VSKPYISRNLVVGEQSYDEEQLLRQGSLFVVLAEPGSGKTELLKRLGQLLDVRPMRASIFRNKTYDEGHHALLIDAMDEVARVDQLGIEVIVEKASQLDADTVIFAGRSSEWDTAETEHLKRYFGIEPVVVKLSAFTQSEQQQLFEAEFPDENFNAFAAECVRLELDVLLGNPQFLLLFGEAYIASDRHFVSKKKIYQDAVSQLALEANPISRHKTRPPNDIIIKMACEVFAKIMLSGSTGVSGREGFPSSDFPYLQSLVADNSQNVHHLTDTRILKPSNDPGLHEPIHRIVAEYCAAKYLVDRIERPADRLSLRRILETIAPNRTVRTELRGMLGWMAALSQGATQRQLIELDPYAVMANGDPSELTAASKKMLLESLRQLADTNPLFRRSDAWRQFNVGTFFNPDIRDDIVALLSPTPAVSPLRDLVLELLSSSHAAGQFVVELHTLALNAELGRNVRSAAYRLLLDNAKFDPRPDMPALLSENSRVSLELGAIAVRSFGSEKLEPSHVVELLRKLAGLYRKRTGDRDRDWSSLYFIEMVIKSLDQQITVQALNQLTKQITVQALNQLTNGLACDCHPKHEVQCICRYGISKIIGLLLDHHLPAMHHHDATQVWQWTRALIFHNHQINHDSPSSRLLDANSELRQEIHRLAVYGLAGEQTEKTVNRFSDRHMHAGIRFRSNDLISLAEYAFKEGLVDVWSALWVNHLLYFAQTRESPLRTLMRGQANSDARFLRVWAKRERSAKRNFKEWRSHSRSQRPRFNRRETGAIEQDRTDFIANRARIEAGEHWKWVKRFSSQYLYEPDQLLNPDYGETPLRALRNCIPFLSPHVPDLEALSQHRGDAVAQVLFAHCLVRFRNGEPLHDLDVDILRAAVTKAQSYPGIEDDELYAIETELNRLVFPDAGLVLAFARAFIEPVLAYENEPQTNVEWLERKHIFHSLRETLPLEWLQRYPKMPSHAQQSLFAMAAKYGDRKRLEALIDERFDTPLPMLGADRPDWSLFERRHRFWALRAFFFCTARRDDAIAELRQDPRSIIDIADLVGEFSHRRNHYIPPLSAEAIFSILDAFVEAWPRVHLPYNPGTSPPDNETAYRFLSNVVWRIGSDIPAKRLPVLKRLLEDERFEEYQRALLAQYADAVREAALADFSPPSAERVSELLDHNDVATVGDLRALMVEVLHHVQQELKGSDTDPLDTFYDGGKRVSENKARNRVVDMIRSRLTALGISVVIEHHMAKGNRADFTATVSVLGTNSVLAVEAKGQWHAELFTAAAEQLEKRYSTFPDASGQGIYLVFWFGNGEKIAGKVDATITSASELRDKILKQMPGDLQKSIDVVVLDLFRLQPTPKPTKSKTARGTRKKSRTDTTATVPNGRAASSK